MPEPNTGGQLRTNIADMEVGDYIKVEFHFNYPYSLIRDFQGSTNEIPLIGIDDSQAGSSARYDFSYLIKVDRGLLVGDRVIVHKVSWDTLNALKAIQGGIQTLNGINGILRSLGGGNSYATADGKSSATDTGNGAWPVDNEWDTYIVKKDYGMGAGRNDVWHWDNIATWCQDTPLDGVRFSSGNNSRRTGRGFSSAANIEVGVPSTIAVTWGFRPVFEYQEVTN